MKSRHFKTDISERALGVTGLVLYSKRQKLNKKKNKKKKKKKRDCARIFRKSFVTQAEN